MPSGANRDDQGAGATRQLARFVCHLRYADLDLQSRHAARRHILDTLGACIAGSGQRVTETAAAVLAGSAGPMPVPGRRERLDPFSAAYLTGTSAHGLELDDGFRAGSVHPGATVLPAALAAAYDTGADGKTFMTAVIAGYEVVARIAVACQPALRRRGFHATSTVGVFGAAAAAGGLLGLGEQAMAHAFGLAPSSAAGLFAFLHGGADGGAHGGSADVKRLHAGHAAREGLLAARLAERGMAGPPSVLECRDGFFQAFAGADPGTGHDLGDDCSAEAQGLAVTRCYIKPHACCRHIQPALDALLEIVRTQDLTPAGVEEIHVGTYGLAAAHAETGWADMASAQLSFPFVLATGLHKGAVTLDHFSEACRRDPEVLADCAKIKVAIDSECESDYPRLRPAKVTLRTTAGQTFRRRIDEPYGAPDNPVTDEALGAKYLDLAGRHLGAERARQSLELLWRLDELTSIKDLADALAG